MKRNNAFTLAELMITIGIVGIVAAITIPLLIQNSNYKKFTTQFRKSLSTLNQAAISAQAQYDMDYGTLTSESTPSTCATDSLSGGQSTMCALLNNTLAGKTYMGVYGEVAGSMILTKYQFTKKTDGFDPANFLIYSMADGSIVGFNPSMKNCSLSGELTKSVLTDSNKLANCIGFIDVNGVSLPNKEVTCSDGTSALEPNIPCTLKSKPWGLGDVFPVVFHNGTVEPATNAAKAFFSGESSGGSDNEDIVFYNASGEETGRVAKYKTANGNKYEYDANNNMYCRVVNSEKMCLCKETNECKNYNGYWKESTRIANNKIYTFDPYLNEYVIKNSDGSVEKDDGNTYKIYKGILYTPTVVASNGKTYELNTNSGFYFTKNDSGIIDESTIMDLDENVYTIVKDVASGPHPSLPHHDIYTISGDYDAPFGNGSYIIGYDEQGNLQRFTQSSSPNVYSYTDSNGCNITFAWGSFYYKCKNKQGYYY